MNVAIPILLALSPAIPAGGGDGDKAVVVHCRTDAELRGAEVLLRDLAEVRTHDPELTRRLLDVSFGRRPAFGFNRVLSRQDIMLRLLREGLKSELLEMDGAREVVLHPVVTKIAAQDILDAANAVLAAAIELETGADIEFEPGSVTRSVLAPPGRYSMDVTARLRDGALQHSSALVDVSILVDGQAFKVVRVPYRLRRYNHVLVATTAIRRGTPLGEHNLALQRVEASSGTSPYLADFESVRGKVAARDLQARRMLTLGALTDPAVVFRGDPVNLVAVNGRIQVATRAVALQDGAVGARIAVRNLTAGKIVQAMVHGQGLVVVQPLSATTR